MVTWWCSPRAMRPRADSGSPWDPVLTSTTWSGGMAAASSRETIRPGATCSRPRSRATPMLQTIERPTKATLRLCSSAQSSTCWMRWTWLAKLETISRCVAWEKTSSSTGPIARSDVTKPGTSALVESDSSRSMPSRPSRAKAPRSVRTPSSGSWSILKSPVCTRTPAGVCTATARASGIEWLTDMNSQWNGPVRWSSPAATSTRVGSSRCSRSLAATSARVNREPTSGMSPRSRSRYGMAPMWSSCPWVRTTASMSPSRCSMTPKSGRIRSTPGCSASGNSTPQSMTSRAPSNSRTAMLRPISPSPPRAITRRSPAGSGGGAFRSRWGWPTRPLTGPDPPRSQGDPPGGEVGAQLGDLLGGRVDQRRAHRTRGQPELAQRRLDQDHALGAEDARVDRQQALVDRPGLHQIAGLDRGDEVGQPGPDEVTHDADHAHGAQGEQRKVQHVLAAVVDEIGARQGPGDGTEITFGVLHRDDPRMLGGPDEGLHLDRDHGPRRDVVEHHRQGAAVGHGREVAEQAGLRRLVVVRRHDHEAVRTEALGVARLFDGVRGVVGAHPGDDGGAIADGVQDHLEHRPLLGVAQRGRFTCRPGDHQAVVGAPVDQVGGQLLRAGQVDGAVLRQRGDHRREHTPEGPGGVARHEENLPSRTGAAPYVFRHRVAEAR